MADIDQEIAEATAKINAALRDPNTTPIQRLALGRESVRLTCKKIVGGQ
jgi:hypothetical protein